VLALDVYLSILIRRAAGRYAGSGFHREVDMCIRPASPYRLRNDDLYRMMRKTTLWASTRNMESRYKLIKHSSELGVMLCKTKF
jgi:hypothetical protein